MKLSNAIRSRSRFCFALGLIVILGLAPLAPAIAASPPTDTSYVRVRLSHQSSIETVELTVDDGPLAVHLPSGGAPVMRLQSGETTTLGLRQSDVYIRRGADGLYATELQLRPAGSDAAWPLSFEDADRTYTGGLHLARPPASPACSW